MKLILLLFLIALELSIVNTENQINTKKSSEKFSLLNRKVSVSSEKPLMLVGFWDYERHGDEQTDGTWKYTIHFDIHFLHEATFPTYEYINMTIYVEYENNTNQYYNISCPNYRIYNATDEVEDIAYICFANVGNDIQIKKVKPIIKFIFNNGTNIMEEYTEDMLAKSSIADDTINNLTNYRKIDINYDVFYLKEIELKDNEFNLKGNFSQSYAGKQIYLNLSGIIYNYTITNDSIKFNASEKIDEYLHGKMYNSTNGTLVLFYAKSGVDDHLVYPISNQYVEVAGFGSYKKPTQTSNATNQLFFTGTQYSLNNLKKYIKFAVTIVYNNLRILESSTPITAYGTRAGIDQDNDLVIYNINYYDTANKDILSMSSPSNFEFSDDGKIYNKSNENIITSSDLNLTNTNNVTVERMEYLSEPDTTISNSLSFDFNLSKLNLRDDKVAYLGYFPFNTGNRKVIKCYIENKTLPYRMTCSPKQYIYTQKNTLKFIITEIKSSSRRLRSLSTETNRTIYPPTNYSGIMKYEYNPGGNVYSRKTGSTGLSAGAIVAIVLATVAAVAAVALAFFFLNRVKVTPPPIKAPSDVNFANTSTNINH